MIIIEKNVVKNELKNYIKDTLYNVYVALTENHLSEEDVNKLHAVLDVLKEIDKICTMRNRY